MACRNSIHGTHTQKNTQLSLGRDSDYPSNILLAYTQFLQQQLKQIIELSDDCGFPGDLEQLHPSPK